MASSPGSWGWVMRCAAGWLRCHCSDAGPVACLFDRFHTLKRIKVPMSKVTFIGAGSVVFTRNLCSDILLTPALQDCTISLMDIDPVRLERSRKLVQALIDRR